MKTKGYTVNRKTVLKLMKSLNILGRQSKNGKNRSRKIEIGKVADNPPHRDFHSDKPFGKPTSDITELKVCDEKVYLSTVPDMFSREIIFYSVSESPDLRQVRDILNGLFEKLDTRPLFHSGQDRQYRHAEYQLLKINGCLPDITLRKACPEKETIRTTA